MSNRNPKRLAAIRLLPCVECGRPPRSQAAHSNFSEHGKGRSIKADDKYTIPLCVVCHGRLDRYEMGMSRDESVRWFMQKLDFIDKVLEDIANDKQDVL